MARIGILILVAVCSFACGGKKDDGAESSPDDPSGGVATQEAPVETPPVADEPPPAELDPAAIPTVEDFEADVAAEITDSTAAKDIAALEEEIGD